MSGVRAVPPGSSARARVRGPRAGTGGPVAGRRLAALLAGLPLVGLVGACAPLTGPLEPEAVALAAAAELERGIILGEPCAEATHPSAVAILAEATISFGAFGEETRRQLYCTGTLIAPDTVLTAAHCLDTTPLTSGFGEVTAEAFYVTFDAEIAEVWEDPTFMGGFPAGVLATAAHVRHPDFRLDDFSAQNVNGPGDFKDVGLLFLTEPVTDVLPAIVIAEDEDPALVVDAPVAIAGWGQQTPEAPNPFEPPAPRSLGVKMCAQSFVNEIGEFEMQVGSGPDTSRKCHGDSGGPTYLDVATSGAIPQRVVGITSHAYDIEDCNKGGIDTRVDVWRGWIEGEMAGACAAGVRSWCVQTGILTPGFVEDVLAEGIPPGDGDGDGDADYTGLVINELDPLADPPWIELYNGSTAAVPRGAVSFRVGAEGSATALPDGAPVAVGAFLVVDLPSTATDGVEIAITAGGQDLDSLTFDAEVPAGCALARVPDGAEDFLDVASATPAATNGEDPELCPGGDGDGDGDPPPLPGCGGNHQVPAGRATPWPAALVLVVVGLVRRRA